MGAKARGGSELTPGLSLVGGSQNLRFYWKEFVNEVDVLVFLVDSADRLRLPWARQELHKLLDKDPDLPVVVVANKQVRATGGRLRPVGLDPQRPGQEQLPWGGPRPGPGALDGEPVPTFSAYALSSSYLPCLLPPRHLSSWRNEKNNLFKYPLDARCGFE